MAPAIETISGQVVDFLAPDPDTIKLHDIAHHLSRINRFNGATTGKQGLSVAQHSVWVALFAWHVSDDALTGLHGLLHDAAEAYIGDICTPLKTMPGIAVTIQPIEARLLGAIYVALELPLPNDHEAAVVSLADRHALCREINARSAKRGTADYWASVRSRIDESWYAQAAMATDQVCSPELMFDPDSARRLWLQTYQQLYAAAEDGSPGALSFDSDAE